MAPLYLTFALFYLAPFICRTLKVSACISSFITSFNCVCARKYVWVGFCLCTWKSTRLCVRNPRSPSQTCPQNNNALVTIVSLKQGKALVVMATAMLHWAQDEERHGEMEILYFDFYSSFYFFCCHACLCAHKEIDKSCYQAVAWSSGAMWGSASGPRTPRRVETRDPRWDQWMTHSTSWATTNSTVNPSAAILNGKISFSGCPTRSHSSEFITSWLGFGKYHKLLVSHVKPRCTRYPLASVWGAKEGERAAQYSDVHSFGFICSRIEKLAHNRRQLNRVWGGNSKMETVSRFF